MNLVIITPFKNEQESIFLTIDSILIQTVKPVRWILIDDNSDDKSPAIVKDYAARYNFIEYLPAAKQYGSRATGNNIVNLFNQGLEFADAGNLAWDVVLKLDADLIIQREDYIEFILSKFRDFPLLGIASGATFIYNENNRKQIESKHKWHTQGPNKFYRKGCLAAIGGLKAFKGWDGIDDILAREHGFITEKFFEQELQHLYPTQTRQSEGGLNKGLLREAFGYRNMGYPFYMYVFKSFKISKQKGLWTGLLFLFYGIKATLTSKPLVSKQEIRAVRQFMIKRIKGDFSYTTEDK
jgi:biofilm PGA synthesis N-glycosyltransferase PgaC